MDDEQRRLYSTVLQNLVESDIEEDPENPGRFHYSDDKYSGYVQFPAPVMLPHFKAYWEKAIKPQADRAPMEWEYWQAPVDGAILLIAEYGEWAIEGVPVGDAKAGDIPLGVSEWLTAVGRVYMYPQLDPKKLLVVSTVI
jgi:hypothetical protein